MWVNISMASTFVFSLSYFPWVGGDLRHFFAARGRFMLFLALQKVHFESAQLSNITYSVIRRCKCCYNKQAFERTLLEFSGCCQISHPFLPLLNPVIRWKWRCSYACIIHGVICQENVASSMLSSQIGLLNVSLEYSANLLNVWGIQGGFIFFGVVAGIF